MRFLLKNIFSLFSILVPISLFCQQIDRPNVVFILADDLGYGDLGCYGSRFIQTPNLDQLAKDGAKLIHFYSPSPLCSPSRASFLTGRTPYRTGINSWIPEGQEIFLQQEEMTLATLLKENGYQTFLSGKWHLNGGLHDQNHTQPQDHGFDKWLALHAFAIPNHKNPTNFFEDGKTLGEVEGYTAGIAVDKAIEYLEGRDKGKPFFLYLPLAEVHSEIASPKEYTDKYAEFTDGVIDLENVTARGPGEYYANTTYMDAQIGRLLGKLDEWGLRNNTIVIFTSDNGPVTTDWRRPWEVNMYGETGGLRGRKADLYEGGLRVPFIIRYPGEVKDGITSVEPAQGYDLLPTVCGLLDIPIPEDREIDGVNIASAFSGNEIGRDEPLFWAFETRPGDGPEGYMYAVRDGKWKLITDESFSKILLFDLENDPYETQELSSQYPEVVQKLISFIREKKASIENDPLRPKKKEKVQEVTILYTNDIESVYDPIDAYWNDTLNKIGGMAQLATLIQETRKNEKLSFLLDAGDIFTGALSSVTYGALPFDIYSSMGYECMTLGNHEFEYGWEKLLDSKQRARFPVLNANIFYKGTDIPYAQAYTILEKGGLRIGLIGVMGVEAFKNTINPLHVRELEVRDPTPIVQKLVDKLRPEVDMIVVLTHQNKSAPMQSDKEVDPSVQRGFDEDYAMAGAVKGIDVILGGHSDNGLWEPAIHPETGTLVGITFGQGKYLGYMKLAVDKEQKKVSLKEGKLIPVISDQLQPHPEIKSLIKKARDENPQLTKVIGNNLSTGFRKYNAESNLGSFLADAIKGGSGADIGLVNPGSIRADLDVGEITVEEIKNIYPFIDQLKVVSVSGKALKELIEYSASLTYGLAQFSGLEITYNLSKPVGKRVVEAKVNGEHIADKETYTIACSGFLARGGDGYRWLKEGKSVKEKPQKLINVLIRYVEERREIDLPEAGRYKFLE